MKILKLIYHNVDRIIAIFCLMFMLIGLTIQTITRYFFHYSTSWLEEISCFCLVWLIFSAASYALEQRAHIRIDSVMLLYPQRMKKYVELLGRVCWVVFCAVMTVVSFQYAMGLRELGTRAIAMPLPMWTIYFAIPFGHFFMTIRLVEQIIRDLNDILHGRDYMAAEAAAADERLDNGTEVG